MFREMRLKEQQLTKEETVEMLNKATHGTLAINGQDEYPYSIPISFAYSDDKIYFHGALEGQKHDLLTADPHICLSVVDLDDVQPEQFTTYYRSVVAYGTAKRMDAPEDIRKVMELIVAKYSPGLAEGGRKYAKSQEGNFCVYEMDIAHMTGKRSE